MLWRHKEAIVNRLANQSMSVLDGIFAIRGDLDGDTVKDERVFEKFLGCFLDGQQYLMPLVRVEEILMSPKITFVPHAAPFVVGVLNLRGQIITVVDLYRLITTNYSAIDSAARVVIIEEPKIGRLGILVNGIANVHSIAVSRIERQNIATRELVDDYLTTMAKLDSGVFGILDLDRILSKVWLP